MSLLGKVHESDDVILKNWLYKLSLMSKHSYILIVNRKMVVWVVSLVHSATKPIDWFFTL